MKGNKQSKPKDEIIEFIRKHKKIYANFTSSFTKEDLVNAFYCRKLFFDCESAVRSAEKNIFDFDGKKTSDNKKRIMRNKFMNNSDHRDTLEALSARIENLEILKYTSNDLISFRPTTRQVVKKLTFLDVFNASKSAHNTTSELFSFFNHCNKYIDFTPDDFPYSRSVNPEMMEEIKKANNSIIRAIPENYPYADDTVALSNLWLSIDLRYSDEIIVNQLKELIEIERKKYPHAVQNNIDKILAIENIKRKLNALDVFIIIDAIILSANKNEILTNTEINNALESQDNDTRNVKNAIDYFMDILNGNLDDNNIAPYQDSF